MKLGFILKAGCGAAAIAAVGLIPLASARADSTGFDSIHGKIRVGGKMCFDGHSHSGNGSGSSRKAAEAQAVDSWAGFTAGEYGSDWAHIGKANNRSMRCSQSAAGWYCDLDATPCR